MNKMVYDTMTWSDNISMVGSDEKSMMEIDLLCGYDSMVINDEHIDGLLNGKVIYFDNGEYVTLIKYESSNEKKGNNMTAEEAKWKSIEKQREEASKELDYITAEVNELILVMERFINEAVNKGQREATICHGSESDEIIEAMEKLEPLRDRFLEIETFRERGYELRTHLAHDLRELIITVSW